MNPLFLTLGGSGVFTSMVKDHEARHRAYCSKWGYEYRAITEDVDVTDPWVRLRLILHAMKEDRFSHVFWVDADTFVADFSHDMRKTLPEWAWLGMTIHPYPWRTPEPWHLQSGMFYFRCCPEAVAFLERCLFMIEVVPDDQTAVNWLMVNGPEAVKWQSGLFIIPYRWNNTLHDQVCNPIVAAFHGFLSGEDRRNYMLMKAKDFPFGG
jgi:hypothetical protein